MTDINDTPVAREIARLRQENSNLRDSVTQLTRALRRYRDAHDMIAVASRGRCEQCACILCDKARQALKGGIDAS